MWISMVTVWTVGNVPYVYTTWTLYTDVKNKSQDMLLPSYHSWTFTRKLLVWKIHLEVDCPVFTWGILLEGKLFTFPIMQSEVTFLSTSSHVASASQHSLRGSLNSPVCSIFNCCSNQPTEKLGHFLHMFSCSMCVYCDSQICVYLCVYCL